MSKHTIIATETASIVTGQLVLSADTHATFIHGITGQEVSEDTLLAGSWVRNHREGYTTDHDGSDSVVTRFEVSTDGGETWYQYRTLGRVEAHYLGTEHLPRA